MLKTFACLTLALAVPIAATAQTPIATIRPASGLLEQDVRAVLQQAPAGTRFGLLVTRADGTVVVAIDPDRRFIPASNTKLFTTALALSRLPAPVPGNGVRLEPRRGGAPDVVLVGRGDARMSAWADCLADCLSTLADAVAARTRKINRVIGDATLFPDQRWSPGMSWNNIGTDSGTAIAALSADANTLNLAVTPGAVGSPPKVAVAPFHAAPYLTVRNEAVTVAEGRRALNFEWAVNGRELRVYGEIPLGEPYLDEVGIDDPAHFAAWSLEQLLKARGVRITRPAISRYRPLGLVDDPASRAALPVPLPVPPPVQQAPDLATLTPPSLIDEVIVVNKVSQNLYAELLLRRVARIDGTGSLADGVAAMQAMLAAAGVPREGYDFADGSGMSTYNRVSPRATAALLRWAGSQPWGADFRNSLPIGGTDGTLRRRFADTPLQGRLWAKTGTLNATSALGGYLRAASGQELIFAIYANDVPDGQSAVAAMDAAILLVAARN